MSCATGRATGMADDLIERLERAARIEAETGICIDIVEDGGTVVLTAADLRQLADRIRELEADRDALTKGLTGLTASGSEFFIRKGDDYVADVDACVAWVRRSKEDAHRRAMEATRRALTAESRLAEAVVALGPFAALIDDVGEDEDDSDTFRNERTPYRRAHPITAGDIRRARQTLSRIKEGSNG